MTSIASPNAAGRQCECRRRVTTPEGCRLGIGCHREPSRVGSRSSCPAGSGLRRPGGVREFRLSTAAVRASGGSDSTFRGLQIKWVGAAVDSRPPLEEAHWDVIPRCRKIASMRPSCILRVGVPNLYGEWNYEHTSGVRGCSTEFILYYL
ncbi:hypothetical protein EVAR_25555_1 [Eumeta japonica]|uniref:Uncharacterized protein n=1 Tax=Eumeta variegata TaxID=151549 RepID=A0A4C1Z6H8_EUMVA|nr:hypothetical protein EVAR_25555_1 [Eumeta japonica]